MRKVVLVLAAFMLAVPVMAQPVAITCTSDGSEVTVKFNNPGAELVRAFALDITVDNDSNIVSMSDFHPEYYIYPGSIDVNDDTGLVDKWGSPDCNVNDYPGVTEPGIGSEGVTIEMGSLYDVNDNDHNQPPPQSNQTICKFVVDKVCSVSIVENSARGGVVMEDPEVSSGFTGCLNCCAVGCVVPDVETTHDHNDVAHAAIIAATLVPNNIGYQRDDIVAADHVISQDPAGGTLVECGSTVDLIISLGPCVVPNVIGMTEGNAETAITDAELVVGVVTYVCHDTIAAGIVVDQNPYNPTVVPCGSAVDIDVSKGQCCMKTTATEFAQWVSWGEPDCWCYKRQCRGDADGIKTMIFWVAVPDLNLLRSAFNKNDAQLAAIPNGICADFDHVKTMIFRVAVPDLNRLRAYFNQPEAAVPCCDNDQDCVLDVTDKLNFWTN